MIPQSKKYFILIVHYGEATVTNKLVTTLLAGQVIPEKIVIIDHAQEPFPFSPHVGVQLVRPQENGGYGAGVNIGLGILLADDMRPDYIVVVMNNDVRVRVRTLAQLIDWWQAHPEPALVGVRGGYVNLFTGRASLAANFQFSIFNFQTLPYIHGAFFSAPYGVLMNLTGMPTEYFLYWEDVLLSRRAQQQDVPLRIAAGVDVAHHDEHKPTHEHLYYLVRNGALFLQQETPGGWRAWWWVINKLRWVCHRGIIRQALGDAARNVVGKMPE